MPRQYIKVAFVPDGTQYTYHNDEPHTIRAGDWVTVTTRAGTDKDLEVLEATNDDSDPPSFATKPCYKSDTGGY